MTDLARIATPELERLLQLVARGVLVCPLGETALRAEGFVADVYAAFVDLDRATVERVVALVVADRGGRPPPRLELVWTGPEPRVASSRDTAVLVRELFANARQSVLIAGFSFDHGAEIFAPLHAAMRDHDVAVEVFLDIREQAAPGETVDAHVRAYATRFLDRNWTFGPPFPVLYYDPRTAVASSHVSLHAKCIVVDAARTLVTSANFTDRGHTRNVELGVLVEDPAFAQQVVGQWRALVDADLVRRCDV